MVLGTGPGGTSQTSSAKISAKAALKGGPKPKKNDRYHSKFGVPSWLDERCVLCQYVVQRTIKALETKVVDDYTIFDERPSAKDPLGGFPGLSQAAGRSGSGTGDRAGLIDQRGQRSPTRMVRQIMATTMRRICGDRSPYLFRNACKDIWVRRMDLAFGVFRKLGSGGSCMETGLCGIGTYVFQNAGVHYPAMSTRINGMRGLCGMVFGQKGRQIPGVSSNMCLAQQVGQTIGLLR